MADTKISALPAATTPLAGTEVIPLNQGGVTSNVTVANLTAGRNITFNNTLPGYTTTATAAGTTTLTSSSTYHQRFTGSSAQTVVLPAATTMAQGQGFVIDNDSSGTLALQDGSTASLGSVTPGMAVYVFCENNSTTAGSWSGYMFVPGAGPSGQVTWGTSGLNMGGQALTNVTTIGAASGSSLSLQANGTTYATILGAGTGNGYFGIGTTSPNNNLHVYGTGTGVSQQSTSGGAGCTYQFYSVNSTATNNRFAIGSNIGQDYEFSIYDYTNSQYVSRYESNAGANAWKWFTAGVQRMTLNNSGSLSFNTSGQGITGTTTNDNATTGVVGEYIVSTVANTSVSLTTNTAANVTSISLTAGDWDVQANVQYNVGATTNMTYWYSTVSTTSGTLGSGSANASNMASPTASGTVFGATAFTLASPMARISLSSTTTVYLVTQAGFTVSTLQAGGTIRARRVR